VSEPLSPQLFLVQYLPGTLALPRITASLCARSPQSYAAAVFAARNAVPTPHFNSLATCS